MEAPSYDRFFTRETMRLDYVHSGGPGGEAFRFERIMPDPEGATEYHYVLIDYVCRITGGTLAAGDDVSHVQWMRESELSTLQITEGTLAVIERAFRKRRK